MDLIERSYSELVYNKLCMENYHPILARIYANRGSDSSDITHTIKKLLPFSELKNIDLVCERLYEAFLKSQKIIIVADYDADGATSCAIAYLSLKGFGFDVDFMVPNRFEHGYGLTPSVVELVKKRFSPDIILTVDNGIASIDGVKLSNSYNIDVIVTDHHLQGDMLPDTEYIVNPNQKSCNFPDKNLAGCGVIFYVMCAYRAYLIKNKGILAKDVFQPALLMDLVALGTIADVVKLTPNNRFMVLLGLNIIKSGRCNYGIQSLCSIAKKDIKNIKSLDLGFSIGPRLNAAGRLDDMSIGIKCLISNNIESSFVYAEHLNSLNTERKDIETEMKDGAIQILENEDIISNRGCVVYSEGFHEGVVGIVSSRIKEMYNVPVITFADAQEESLLKGSARSIPGFHIRDALDLVYKKKPECIVKFGGHSMAAGVTVPRNKYLEFRDCFLDVCRQEISIDMVKKIMNYDCVLSPSEITYDLAYLLENEVWGQFYEEPIFVGDFVIEELRLLSGAHTKFTLSHDAGLVEAIFFNNADDYVINDKIKMAYSIDINRFNNNEKLNLMIKYVF